jgi:iron complex transport system substrate-binding protein
MTHVLLKYGFLIIIIFNSCSDRSGRNEKKEFRESKNGVEYADRFTIEMKDGYSVLTIINPWQGAVNISQVYYLVKRGNRIPEGVDSSEVIFVPVRKIICMSTTHLAMISAINEEETVKGVSGSDFLYNQKLIELIKNGRIVDIGYEDNLNKELVIQISPDLIMVYGVGNESAGYLSKIKEMGMKVIFNADYLETDPLGKAEWIKVFGALYCKEKEANILFSSIAEEYNRLKVIILQKTNVHPTVLLGLPWKDTWFISPGNSYICKMISDAGGNYLWKDTQSDISMPFGLENVFIRALDSDIWLNTGSANNKKEITAIDKRLGDLPSFKKGKIFNNNKRISIKGGNDYWESGCINPHIILKDIASILHPDLFPDYELYYYRKIE